MQTDSTSMKLAVDYKKIAYIWRKYSNFSFESVYGTYQ